MAEKSKALVILSGGQDSTTCLFLAGMTYEEVHAITFDYGQRHKLEIEAAKKVAKFANVSSHEIVKLPEGILQGRSFLTDLSLPVETFSSISMMEHHNAFKENKLDSSFVPMRNPLFFTIAANRAYVLGCSGLYTGITAADFAEYGGFTWDWLGGFIDAEGCFTQSNDIGYKLSFYQNDPELFHRISKWIKEQFPDFTNGFSVRNNNAEFSIGKKAYSLICEKLSPHLHNPLRRAQAQKHGAPLCEEAPLSDSYVTGFWEGDGGCFSRFATVGKNKQHMTAVFSFLFYQKDPVILEKIQAYLGFGSVHPAKDQWKLNVSDGPVRAKLLTRLKKHFCVLNSFAKIDKNRQKIGMFAGGFNPPYPDCSPDFVFAYQKALDESLKSPELQQVKIETPLMYLTKAQSVLLAHSMPNCWEALAFTHTAYDGQYPPIGRDHATLLRAKGFFEANLPDPLVVRANKEGLMDLPITLNYDFVRSDE